MKGGESAADLYNGLSDASSTYTATEADESELELGLTLGSSTARQPQPKLPCRILTAEDFPSFVSSRLSPLSPSSVSSSSSPSPPPPSSATASNAPPSQVVGWPPIRAYRMNSLVSQSKDTMDSSNNNDDCKNKKQERGGVGGPSMFLKVNMDGVPIGRKIDLNAHLCYQTLARALEEMFSISYASLGCSRSGSGKEGTKASSKLLGGLSEFVLTYEDRDGDWMLVGDVPWGMFLSTVKRLRIMRTSEANGLGPRFQRKADGQRS
ncbi:Auxin-responsive protein IAA10 [Acorus gramineus]|uniref:Auxin-responsive protein n=1 Tax=Acorus gramineus TaxID=55184 RepID=A0AAV9A7V3_ACOGR|nr:Auxin-responsive protein IAA10 [Acorus gramineus]